MKEYIGQKTVSLVAGGYLADNKRITNKPIICNPEIITLDYSGELLSDFPIVINENTPVIFSLFGDENKVQVNSDQGIIRINLYENK